MSSYPSLFTCNVFPASLKDPLNQSNAFVTSQLNQNPTAQKGKFKSILKSYEHRPPPTTKLTAVKWLSTYKVTMSKSSQAGVYMYCQVQQSYVDNRTWFKHTQSLYMYISSISALLLYRYNLSPTFTNCHHPFTFYSVQTQT